MKRLFASLLKLPWLRLLADRGDDVLKHWENGAVVLAMTMTGTCFGSGSGTMRAYLQCFSASVLARRMKNFPCAWKQINDNEWNRIKDMFPPEHPKSGKRGRPAKYDNRSVINGILWIARTGAHWREFPERYGKWQAVYARYRLWKQKDLFASIFAALSADADMENLSIDSTSCKVHRSSNGGKNGRQSSRTLQRRNQHKNPCGSGWPGQSVGFSAMPWKRP